MNMDRTDVESTRTARSNVRRHPSPNRRPRAPHPAYRHGPRRVSQPMRPWRWAAMGAGVLISVFFLLSIVSMRVAAGSDIAPGVQVLGIGVGGLSRSEALTAVEARSQIVLQKPVNLVAGDKVVALPAAELGLTFDVPGTVALAESAGRDGAITPALRVLGVGTGPVLVDAPIIFDAAKFQSAIDRVLQTANLATKAPSVQIVDGQVSILAGQAGMQADIQDAAVQIQTAFGGVGTPTVTLRLSPGFMDISAEELQPIANQVQAAIAEPIVLSAGGSDWQLDVALMVNGADIVRASDDSLRLDLQSRPMEVLSTSLTSELQGAVRDAQIGDGGQYGRLIESNPGHSVDFDSLEPALVEAILQGKRAIAVPVFEQQPAVSTDQFLQLLGVTTLLAVGESDFSGSEAGRITNVLVAAGLVDGLLVPAGQTFSFNSSIGSIVEVPGFVPAGATENGIPGTSVGGGVCQVSTSIFRAALLAGLPISEWWPHAYRSVYYEQDGWAPGFDASIQQPDEDPFGGSDLKFVNPTDGWLLIRAEIVDGTLLRVSVYGQPTGYRVEIDDPQFSEWIPVYDAPTEEIDPSLEPGSVIEVQPRREGVQMTISRTVYGPSDEIVIQDTFVSNYQPAPAVFRVSPDMVGSTATG